MPTRKSSDSPHRHSDPKPARPRKSKPKFELPPGIDTPSADTPSQDVGWVYRADTEAPAVAALTEPLPATDIAAVVAEVAAEVHPAPVAERAAELAHEAVLSTGKPAPELPPLPPVAHESPNITRLAIMTGMGVFAIGIITTGLVGYAAYSLMAAPFRIAKSLVSSN